MRNDGPMRNRHLSQRPQPVGPEGAIRPGIALRLMPQSHRQYALLRSAYP